MATGPMPGLVAISLVALLVARAITPLERRLVTGAALIFAGLFLTARPGSESALVAVGLVGWAAGLGTFLHAGVAWRETAASRAGPWAVVLLLPPAFFGAVVLFGLAAALLPEPVRGVLRVVGG